MTDIPDYEGDDDIIEHYENQESDDERGSHKEDATSDNETGTARRVDPLKSKSHVVRNPVPKLNTERLKGPNGIQTIEKYFEGFKFYGKGHERTDLDRIMKRLEHWSYRLFPKYHFDDFLTRVEQLGTKKDLQTFIKKYRLDQITSDNDLITHDNMDKDDENEQEESIPLDDYDLLITEQIQKQKQAETRASIDIPSTSNEDAFDKLLMQSTGTQDSHTDIQVSHTNTIANEMSAEIKQRIERNKQLAIQRRLEKQKEREEEIKRTKFDNTNTEILNESDNLTIHDEINISDMRSPINENINKAIVNETILLNEESMNETDHV